MAQHDYNLANQSGADFRADLNNALSAIVTVNSGATAPSTTFAHQLWVDTSSSVLKIRNSANDAWVTTGVSITADNTFAGNLTGNVTGNLTGDVTGNADTATALETARTINGASFDGTANISFGTDSVSEGSSNLYFTNARVESYLDAGTSTPTFASAVINTSLTGSAILDDDTFGTASATTVATSESIKSYVDSQVGSVDTLAEILLNGNTTGGTDIAFGDNDKAIFGTGSDLSIFHDGSHSRIKDTGTGSLIIDTNGNGVLIEKDTGENLAYFDAANNRVLLYYNDDARLTTTSSGVNISGTVTSDGLTVEAPSNALIRVSDSTNTNQRLDLTHNGGVASFISGNNGAYGIIKLVSYNGTDTVDRLKIANNGDISFYDDTGSTQGLFWDASTERLGLGTTTPDVKLHLSDSTDGSIIRLERNDTAIVAGDIYGGIEFEGQDASTLASGVRGSITGVGTGGAGNMDLVFNTAKGGSTTNRQRLRISSLGDISFYEDTGTTQALFWDASAERLGIGTTNPSETLTVVGNIETLNTIIINNGTYKWQNLISSGSLVTRRNYGGTWYEAMIIEPSGNATFAGTVTSDGLTVGDGHTIGDDSFDNLVIEASTGENIRLVSDHATLPIDISSNQGLLVQTILGTDRFKVDASTGDISFYDDTGTSQNLKWDASADTLNFVDNAKATFGNSDLQIYHTGTTSFIANGGNGSLRLTNGTGNIELRASTVALQDNSAYNYLRTEDLGNGGRVRIYHEAVEVMKTESTGIDVTGTVTSDGLTVGANDKIQFGTSDITGIYRTNSGSDFTMQHWGNLSMLIDSDNNDSGTRQFMIGRNSQDASTATKIALFSEGGDISFYDDTGTTQGLFWDAGAESLGIGTTNPAEKLHVRTTGVTVGKFETTATADLAIELKNSQGSMFFGLGGGEEFAVGTTSDLNGTGNLFAIKQDGKVGIGTTSPSQKLEVAGNIQATGTRSISALYDSNHYIRIEANSSGGVFKGTDGGVTTTLVRTYGDSYFNGGNLGIGTTSPSSTLHIKSGTENSSVARFEGFNPNRGLEISTGADATVNDVFVHYNQMLAGYGGHKFDVGDSTLMTIDHSGNVGIGTDNPSSVLEIAKNDKTNGATLSITNTYNSSGYTAGDVVGTINFRTDDSSTTQPIRGQIKLFDDSASGSSTYAYANAMSFSTGYLNTLNERMRIDSSGNVGIGTDNPNYELTVAGGSNNSIQILSSTTGTGAGNGLRFWNTGSSTAIWNYDNTPTLFGTNNSERMRIDSNGQLLVGGTTSSPNNVKTVIFGTGNASLVYNSGHTGLHINNENATAGSGNFGAGISFGRNGGASDDQSAAIVPFQNSSDEDQVGLAFFIHGTNTRTANLSEAMRLDSSGNVLVGKTSNSIDTVGGLMRANGQIGGCADGNYAGVFNRKTSDGDIVLFRKDSTTVGSIGSLSNHVYIGNGDTSLRFIDSLKAICPLALSTSSDAVLDLGRTAERFKDLYLSGGVQLGGTGAANKLDDYEEGTFTPEVTGTSTTGTGTYSTQSGRYTKIGNKVSIEIVLAWSAHTGTGNMQVDGLPFNTNGVRQTFTMTAENLTYTGEAKVLSYFGNDNFLQIFQQSSNASLSALPMDSAVTYMVITGMYETNS